MYNNIILPLQFNNLNNFGASLANDDILNKHLFYLVPLKNSDIRLYFDKTQTVAVTLRNGYGT